MSELKNLLVKENKAASPYAEIVAKAESQVEDFTEESRKRQANNKKAETDQKVIEDSKHLWSWKIWLILFFGVITFIVILFAALYRRNQ